MLVRCFRIEETGGIHYCIYIDRISELLDSQNSYSREYKNTEVIIWCYWGFRKKLSISYLKMVIEKLDKDVCYRIYSVNEFKAIYIGTERYQKVKEKLRKENN